MKNKFELVEKYNIDVDVFIDEDGVTPTGKLPDNHLTKEFLRLYFTGQITNVRKRWLSDIYYAITTKGEEISLPKTNLTAWDIEKIINDKRGGKRAGAGSKLKTGYSTTTLRIPFTLKENFKCYIDMYTQYFKGDEENIPYYTNEEDRLETIRDMMSALKHEDNFFICEYILLGQFFFTVKTIAQCQKSSFIIRHQTAPAYAVETTSILYKLRNV